MEQVQKSTPPGPPPPADTSLFSVPVSLSVPASVPRRLPGQPPAAVAMDSHDFSNGADAYFDSDIQEVENKPAKYFYFN